MRKDDKPGLFNESFGAMVATIKALEDGGITAKGLARLRSDKSLAALVSEIIERDVAAEKGGWSAMITVDYGKTLDEHLSVIDCAWKHKHIGNENFPIPLQLKGEKLRKAVKLFRFESDGLNMPDDYRFATIFELLAYYRQVNYSQVFTIVAAGSEIERITDTIPVVNTVDHKMRLDLRSRSEISVVGNYFLGIKI